MKNLFFKNASSNILILTGSAGSGHISVARAISEALHRTKRKNLRVEIIDLLAALKTILARAVKTVYLSSLKISPKLYELLYRGSENTEWPLQALNALSAPFMQKKFEALLKKKQPRVLISTYPVWNILAKKAWEKYSSSINRNGPLPFISVITDSENAHSAWMQGNPDYFIVANVDTGTALKSRGVSKKRIKVFGYPVSGRFQKHEDCEDFRRKFNLSPRKKTLLLVLSGALRWTKVKKILSKLQRLNFPNLQLVIVAAGERKWEKKIQRMSWPFQTAVTGWTNEMHTAIHAADIVLTKAGGATVMECIASGKPMVIYEALPGQETGNAALVQKYNLGAVLNKDMSDLSEALQYIFKNETLIKKNLAGQQRPHAAEDTAKFLLGLL